MKPVCFGKRTLPDLSDNKNVNYCPAGGFSSAGIQAI